jgi:hypothetical protein
MAAGLSVDLDCWRDEFGELMLRIGSRFARVEPRRRAAAEAAQVTGSFDKVDKDREDPRWSRARATTGPGYAGFVLPGLPEAVQLTRSLVRRASVATTPWPS